VSRLFDCFSIEAWQRDGVICKNEYLVGTEIFERSIVSYNVGWINSLNLRLWRWIGEVLFIL